MFKLCLNNEGNEDSDSGSSSSEFFFERSAPAAVPADKLLRRPTLRREAPVNSAEMIAAALDKADPIAPVYLKGLKHT